MTDSSARLPLDSLWYAIMHRVSHRNTSSILIPATRIAPCSVYCVHYMYYTACSYCKSVDVRLFLRTAHLYVFFLLLLLLLCTMYISKVTGREKDNLVCSRVINGTSAHVNSIQHSMNWRNIDVAEKMSSTHKTVEC